MRDAQSLSTLVVAGSGDIAPTKYELEDLTLIAEDEGISVETAIQRFGWQEQFSNAVAAIREAYPDTFAGSSMNDGFVGGSVTFVGEVPAAAVKYVSDLPVDVRLIGGAPYSRTQIDASVTAAHRALYSASRPDSVSTYFDVDAGTVVATLYTDDKGDRDESRQLTQSMDESVAQVGPTGGADVPVELK